MDNYPMGDNSKAPWNQKEPKDIPFDELKLETGNCEMCEKEETEVFKNVCQVCYEKNPTEFYDEEN